MTWQEIETAPREVHALEISFGLPLSTGAKVFGARSKEGGSTCYELTSADGDVRRFALTDEALDAMLAIRVRLLAHEKEGGRG